MLYAYSRCRGVQMGEECLNCAGPASKQYTLVVDSGNMLEEMTLCGPCIAAFREEDWIEVYKAPVLTRRGEENQLEVESK